MMNSIRAAQHPHTFVYTGWEVNSKGNTLAHAILRGSVDRYGQTIPNYHYEDLQTLCQMYAQAGLANPAVIVDTNHSNSAKNTMNNHVSPRKLCIAHVATRTYISLSKVL